MLNKKNIQLAKKNASTEKIKDSTKPLIERFVISQSLRKLLRIGLEPAVKPKSGDFVVLYDGDIAVIKLDMVKLAAAVTKLADEQHAASGIIRLYDMPELAVEVNYQPNGVLSTDKDPTGLIWWFAK